MDAVELEPGQYLTLEPGMKIESSIPKNPDIIGDVTLFMEIMGQDLPTVPTLPDRSIRELRSNLDQSEFDELQEAEERNSIQMIADAIGDLIYVLVGHANAYGIPLANVWRVIQAANMSKLWTLKQWHHLLETGEGMRLVPNAQMAKELARRWTATPIPPGIYCTRPELKGLFVVKDAQGKVQKPPTWQEPNINAALYHSHVTTIQPEVSPSSRRRDEAHPNLPVPGKEPSESSPSRHDREASPTPSDPKVKPSINPHKEDPLSSPTTSPPRETREATGPAPPPNFNTPGRDR